MGFEMKLFSPLVIVDFLHKMKNAISLLCLSMTTRPTVKSLNVLF